MPQIDPFHDTSRRSSATGHGGLRRGQLLPAGCGHARADGGLPSEVEARLGVRPAALRGSLCRRALPRVCSPTGSSNSQPRHHGGMRRRQLLPDQSRDTRADGRVSLEGRARTTYVPPACVGVFADVTCPSLFADWIEELAAEQITGGCGGGTTVRRTRTRAQMSAFLVKTFQM